MEISPESLLKLQNGSDVRGVAMDTPEKPANLTGEAARRIAAAFARWLSARLGKPTDALTVAVGHDSRLTAGALKKQILRGLTAEGASALDCSLASTPSMFMATVFPETACDGAVMITASHLPKNRNGMKFFTASGGLDKPDITAILKLATESDPGDGEAAGAKPFDLLGRYSAHLRETISAGIGAGARPLEGLRVVIDAGNGAGGFFVSQVLEPLGADCTGSQFLEPDGNFPNHAPNPEDKQAMDSLRRAVLAQGADLGIIFDTDVDRMGAVLADGTEVNRDAVIAMMAAILAPDYPGGTIVTDSVTSDRLTAFLEDTLGLKHHRFKRGYKNVINEAVRLESQGVSAPLAIETSGHGAMKENYYLDDGAYMAVKLLIAAAKARRRGESVGALIASMPPAFEEKEYRLPISGEGFADYGRQVLKAFEQRAKAEGITVAPSFEGVRLTFPNGWLLLRLSLHDPLLPLNIEGNAPGDCAAIAETAKRLLAGFGRLTFPPFFL